MILAGWCAHRAGLLIAAWRNQPSHVETALSIPQEKLDFGEVWEDEAFSWRLPIENLTNEAIEVSNLSSSCTCTRVEPRSFTLPARGSREVILTLDLSARASKVAEAPVREFKADLSALVARPRTAVAGRWSIRGVVRSAFRFDEPSLDLGRHSAYAQPLATRAVGVTSFVQVARFHVSTSEPAFAAEIGACGNGKCEILLKGTYPLSKGHHPFKLVVTPELAGGKRLPPKTLPVAVTVVADVESSPPVAAFGARTVGEAVEENVTLFSLTNTPFQVDKVEVKGHDLVVERAPGGKTLAAYLVKQKVTQAGHHESLAVFHVRDHEGRRGEVPVTASYVGITQIR